MEATHVTKNLIIAAPPKAAGSPLQQSAEPAVGPCDKQAPCLIAKQSVTAPFSFQVSSSCYQSADVVRLENGFESGRYSAARSGCALTMIATHGTHLSAWRE